MTQQFRRIASSVVIGAVALMLFGCGGGGGSGSSVDDTMMPGAGDGGVMMPPTDTSPSLPTDPQAIAAAAGRVRDASSTDIGKVNDEGLPLTGYLYNDETLWSGSRYTSMSQYYRDGSRATALVYYNESGDLQLIGGPFAAEVPLQSNPAVWPFRLVRSDILDREVEGVTRSYGPIQDHALGEEWRGIQGVNSYEGGGTLTFRVFTDLEEADNPGNPFVGHVAEDANYRNIVLNDPRVPDIPANQDGVHISVPADGLRGTLDGVTGTFSCAVGSANYCALEDDRHSLAPGYIPSVFDPVKFTPDDGSAEVMLVFSEVMEVNTSDSF